MADSAFALREKSAAAFVNVPVIEQNRLVAVIFVNNAEALTKVVAKSEPRRRPYETFLENSPDLAYVFDLDHRFTYANKVLLNMWNRTWDEAIGKTCLELGYEPWHAELHDREIDQVISTKQFVRGEVPFSGRWRRGSTTTW
jgi:PAS domain S-box-containing protein